jgi:hypothetical protein
MCPRSERSLQRRTAHFLSLCCGTKCPRRHEHTLCCVREANGGGGPSALCSPLCRARSTQSSAMLSNHDV